MSFENTTKALDLTLKNMTLTGFDVVLENSPYSPNVNQNFVKGNHLGQDVTPPLGGGCERSEGIFQVDIHTRQERGSVNYNTTSDLIANEFRPGAIFSFDGVDGPRSPL